MNKIEQIVKDYTKYCEPYGGQFETGISIINSGYTGEIYYNTEYKPYSDFWRLLQENTDKLIKEIRFISNAMISADGIVEESRILVKKLSEHKAPQRAAAQYISMFGTAEDDKELRKHLLSLKDITYTVSWSGKPAIEFVQEQDTTSTLFYFRPSVTTDVISDKMLDMLSSIKGSWILDWFYSNELVNKYKDFKMIYGYDSKEQAVLKLKVQITNLK